jgi:hypothetical protein
VTSNGSRSASVTIFGVAHSSAVPARTTSRSLDLIPTVTFQLVERWSPAFYPENPIVYNFDSSKWFAPLDVLPITRSASGSSSASAGR